jgi:hypothetical protein
MSIPHLTAKAYFCTCLRQHAPPYKQSIAKIQEELTPQTVMYSNYSNGYRKACTSFVIYLIVFITLFKKKVKNVVISHLAQQIHMYP